MSSSVGIFIRTICSVSLTRAKADWPFYGAVIAAFITLWVYCKGEEAEVFADCGYLCAGSGARQIIGRWETS